MDTRWGEYAHEGLGGPDEVDRTDSRRRRYALDVIPALVVAGFVAVGVTIAPAGRTDLDGFGYLLVVAASLTLVARRHAPHSTLVVATVFVFGYLLSGYPGAIAAFPVMIGLFTAVRSGGRRPVMAVPCLALVALVVTDMTVVGGRSFAEVFQQRFLLAGWLVAAAVLGAAFRNWGAYVHEVEQRAAEAERTREETARRRAADERLRIARELHDSLTHHISIIKVQTGVAVHLARKRGEDVPEALVAAQEASGEAMRELRATLTVLRENDETPGLARIPGLVERARSTGLPVTVTVCGEERPLPGEVDRAAYRIVQEALTNVSRHAGPATAWVRVDYGADELTIRVDDDGLATPEVAPTPGVGLTGMRERVTELGGRLYADPRPEGGFTVRAEFPVPAAAEAGDRDAVLSPVAGGEGG